MIQVGGLHVNKALYDFVEKEVLVKNLGVESSRIWSGLEAAIRTLGPQNYTLLQKRDSFQAQIDEWCDSHQGQRLDIAEQKNFLQSIGYLEKIPDKVKIIVNDVDPELAQIPAPQLVVPLNNARFAINACNARWGSLYDALYGTDILAEINGCEKKGPDGKYNPERGQLVIDYAMSFLDKAIPLNEGSYKDTENIQLVSNSNNSCHVVFSHGETHYYLKDPSCFVGYNGAISPDSGPATGKAALLFCHNELHIEILLQPTKTPKQHPTGIIDIVIESAVSTIQDCEDSVAVVDAEDKILLYRNWLGLICGDLTAEFESAHGHVTRHMVDDKKFTSAGNGSEIAICSRSLLLIRHTAHHVYTDIVTVAQTGAPIPEPFLDAFITCLISLIDILKLNKLSNSRTGSIYVVKPKLHGPHEVRLVDELFSLVEDTLGLVRFTIKLGIMDEERRTSLNLKSCLKEVSRRVIFINTGFLDRTGDEIHTSFNLGPFKSKSQIKAASWIKAYEDQNVAVGLSCGLIGNGQIGKGMWAEPDGMKAMVTEKIKHPESGASTAWVPSPTAATLHAMHYHEVSVKIVQEALMRLLGQSNEGDIYTDDLLAVPIMQDRTELTRAEIQKELENNLQGLLGYVVRWVDHGIGCSKVPDINGVALMEDRATLRISSQLVTNWLKHGLVGEAQVFDTMRHMAAIVDGQNASDPQYKPMESRPFSSLPFQAALDLVFQGSEQPNGYTELILMRRRRQAKKAWKGNTEHEELYISSSRAHWSKM